jgi:hypothetical protein
MKPYSTAKISDYEQHYALPFFCISGWTWSCTIENREQQLVPWVFLFAAHTVIITLFQVTATTLSKEILVEHLYYKDAVYFQSKQVHQIIMEKKLWIHLQEKQTRYEGKPLI